MKYVKPSYEKTELEAKDIITSSAIEDNGEGTITVGETTISGKEGTFAGWFENLL